MKCPDDLKSFQAELASEIAKINDKVVIQGVACGSVIITLIGDSEEVQTVSTYIVDTGLNLPSYGKVGGEPETLEKTTESSGGVPTVVIVVVVIVLVLVLLGAIWYSGKHQNKKKEQKEAEMERERWLWAQATKETKTENVPKDVETPTAEKIVEFKTPGEQGVKLDKQDPVTKWSPTSNPMTTPEHSLTQSLTTDGRPLEDANQVTTI
jgi:hypothetical protein